MSDDWHYDAPPEKWRVGMLILVEANSTTVVARRRIEVIGDELLVDAWVPRGPQHKPWDHPTEERPGTYAGGECEPEGLPWGGVHWGVGIIGWHPGIADQLENLNKEISP